MATRTINRHSPSYDDDVYGWAMAQAELIRSGRLSDIDIENVAEEIESVGKSEARALESALRVLLLHLLKWEHQPKTRSRSWSLTIAQQRDVYADVLRDNPSLKPWREEARRRAYRYARREAAKETGLAESVFPAECPFDWDETLTASRTLDT